MKGDILVEYRVTRYKGEYGEQVKVTTDSNTDNNLQVIDLDDGTFFPCYETMEEVEVEWAQKFGATPADIMDNKCEGELGPYELGSEDDVFDTTADFSEVIADEELVKLGGELDDEVLGLVEEEHVMAFAEHLDEVWLRRKVVHETLAKLGKFRTATDIE
jgi:hypothetical protein